MMYYLQIAIIVIYAFFMLFILLYSFSQISLIYNYVYQNKKIETPELIEFPIITIQLPIFNEKYVIERLINAVCAFDYPKEKLEIQVLDDSTDETVEIVNNIIKIKLKEGFDIVQIRRNNRKGFKAGALEEATKYCKGEFIAIFDADFVPNVNFLQKTIPYFIDSNIGVVQTRWGHLNQNYSLLTSLQAFGLDAHFSIEQVGRNVGNHFINFNGTAGVWRKSCIIDAGGWSDDTLTEDLDLSYRAQMNGWKFQYLENVESPAELPAVMSALKAQQYRWTKGAAECAKKNLGKVFNAKNISLKTKILALFHLMNSFVFICIMGIAILSIPILYIKNDLPQFKWVFYLGGLFLISLVILGFFYRIASKKSGMKFELFLLKFPMFLAVSMGLSFHNAKAVLEGLLGIKSAFIRTPKFNLLQKSDQWKTNNYIKAGFKISMLIEAIFASYFIYGLYIGYQLNDYNLIPFHLLLVIGFSAVFIYNIKQAFQIKKL